MTEEPAIFQPLTYNIIKGNANLLFPSHTRITEKEFSSYYNAFLCMNSKFIRDNISVINEAIWTFSFEHTFFCIIHNPGLRNEIVYFGIIKTQKAL